jgi:hypothetical protein
LPVTAIADISGLDLNEDLSTISISDSSYEILKEIPKNFTKESNNISEDNNTQTISDNNYSQNINFEIDDCNSCSNCYCCYYLTLSASKFISVFNVTEQIFIQYDISFVQNSNSPLFRPPKV